MAGGVLGMGMGMGIDGQMARDVGRTAGSS